MPQHGMRGYRVVMGCACSGKRSCHPIRKCLWLLPPMKARPPPSCPGPPLLLPQKLWAEPSGSGELSWDPFAQRVPSSPTHPLLPHWLWINSLGQLYEPPLPPFCISVTGPISLPRWNHTLTSISDTYLGLEMPVVTACPHPHLVLPQLGGSWHNQGQEAQQGLLCA